MATTANGWPYVEPADHPVEYPNVSQTLANLLDSRLGSLRVAHMTKGSDQAGLTNGASAGFTATLTAVPTGSIVVGLILAVTMPSSGTVPSLIYHTPVWTGGTGTAPVAPMVSYTAINQYRAEVAIASRTGSGGDISLGYTVTTGAGAAWTCSSRSQIILVALV